MSINLWTENDRMIPCKQTFLAGQQSGPRLSVLIWQQQIVFMVAPQPSIRPATEDLADNTRGHTIAMETAFKSSLINNNGCWHGTKRKTGERGTGQSSVSCVLFGQNLAPVWVGQILTLQKNFNQYSTTWSLVLIKNRTVTVKYCPALTEQDFWLKVNVFTKNCTFVELTTTINILLTFSTQICD